jgi:predicted CXXCH cytochrome family protein
MLVLAAAAALLSAAGAGHGAMGHDSSHMDRLVNSEGCGACHRGRGVSGGGLLRAKAQNLCYKCHSRDAAGKGRAASDIESEMQKTSVHPVEETSHMHRNSEVLPARSAEALRHVSCSDCHLSHVTSPSRAWNGLPGYRAAAVRGMDRGGRPQGIYLRKAEYEYELCYRCHSTGANMRMDSRDVSMEFDPSGMSFHPVEATGRNHDVPSLVEGLRETSLIRCGSCHGNDDPGGPDGPHGSRFSPLLVAEYRTTDGPESAMSYTLCYTCHDRNSIMADESFRAHRFHVALKNVSCKKCHNAHGSRSNRHLIHFDEAEAGSASDGMGPMYLPGAPGMPQCFLSCHGADHKSSGINEKPWPW